MTYKKQPFKRKSNCLQRLAWKLLSPKTLTIAFHRKTALIEAEQYREGLEDGIDERGPYLDTLEGGRLYIPQNGWIVTGAQGERWAIQDDIFRMTYEPAIEAV